MNNFGSTRVSNRRLFAASHATRSIGWSIIDLLLAWHLHMHVGLNGFETGLTMFAFLVIGGIVTFLVGLLFGRLRVTGRSVVDVQLPATIGTAVLLWMQFWIDNTAGVIIAGVAFRLTYAVQDVAQNMLASLLPADDDDMHDYARLRVMLSAATRCVVASGFAFSTKDDASGMLAIIGVSMIGAAASLKGLVFPAARSATAMARYGGAGATVRLRSLLAAWLVAATLLPTLNRLMIFMPAIDGAPGFGPWLLMACCLGSVAGPATLRKDVDNRVLLAAIGGSGLLVALPLPIATQACWRVCAAIVHGIAVSMVGVHLWAATARLAMNRGGGGSSSGAVVYGSVLLTIHLASALGMLALGPLIEGFEAGRRGVSLIAVALTGTGAVLVTVLPTGGRKAIAAA